MKIRIYITTLILTFACLTPLSSEAATSFSGGNDKSCRSISKARKKAIKKKRKQAKKFSKKKSVGTYI